MSTAEIMLHLPECVRKERIISIETKLDTEKFWTETFFFTAECI